MKDIINQVKSPFTDEMVKKLIEQYISWDEDFSEFYRKINGVDFSNSSNSWKVVLSEKNYLKEPHNGAYRIYLNLKGEDKATAVQGYVQQCEARGKGYRFKYSVQDGRDDEIVIITDAENLGTDIEIIEQITESMQLGQLPSLVGIYGGKIGIAEEYTEVPIYSYTEVRLDMIPKAIAKYIFDNSLEFIEYCDDKQVKLIDEIQKLFAKHASFAMININELPEDSVERKRRENEKNAYEENINLGQIGYGTHVTVVRELIKPLRQYMADNSQKALPEMVSNFRTACQAHGISKQGVFSLSTEVNGEKILPNAENQEQTLTELQQELEKLKNQERRTTQKREETKLLRNAYKAELNRRSV